jgi:predicted small secreted protein
MSRKSVFIALAMCGALLASACNTVRGAGEDLTSVANDTQEEINK